MRGIASKSFWFLVAWMVSIPSWAADGTTISEISAAAKRTGDKSREALVAIYGNVVNNPLAGGDTSGDTILASIFQVFNGALLVVGAIWACYIVFRKLTRTAHDGSVFDKQQTTIWGPVRLVWGLVSLVPTASGWSLSQLLMLWGASVMGIGIANLGVDSAITAFSDGTSMVVQPVMPSTVSLGHSVFEANLCLHGINAGIAQAQASGALVTQNGYVQQSATQTGFILKNASFVCGGADVQGDLEPQAVSTNFFGGTIDVSDIRKAHLAALTAMQASLSTSAQNFVNAVIQRQLGKTTALPDVEMAVQSAAQAYENSVNRAAATKQGNIGELSKKMTSSIKEAGWWTLGAWYQTFAQANTKLSDAMAAKASVFGMSSSGDPAIVNVYAAAMEAYQAQQQSSTFTSTLGTQTSGDYSKGAGGSDAGSIIGSIFSAPGQRIVNYLVDVNAGGEGLGQVNPLIKMKNLGDYTMVAAETAMGGYVAAKTLEKVKDGWSIAGAFSKVANAVTSLGDALSGVLDAVGPFIIMLIITLFILGGTLSTYLPMVPFIIWFGAAVNWLVVVGEAVIAAPLWAITHLNGEGDGMGQKTTHGYIFLLNVMVRPILMVLGFFLGGAALIAGGTLLNQLFGVALANAQFDSITGLFSIIFFLMIYCSMCLNLVHSCFNLIMIVPDQVINWVGGHASATMGRDDNEKMKNAMNVFGNKLEHLAPRPGPSGGRNKGPTGGDGIKS
ncbi:DotA/TraY family protein [Pseudomonas syringae]|uniref:DotA/TraY family protein n=1 Tax=Pseudomonas syringae pv. papulans TaxID=83963 RepID=A0AA43IXS9_PSESX|nr:DotA/TraY family protein [Pseudomonas syringae]MDH4603692.1 DotA/TraY family protein [Pseudomonas syringae pv. papulans]MDH4625503.1 DotA/TraY family protein [Pseudomonas syringae pv. papulans]